MGSVFEGVPALQMPPDYSNILQSLSDGLEQRRARQKQNEQELLSKTIGSKLATGDSTGAANAAFTAGDVGTGLKIQELSKDQQQQFAQTVARIAASATDEQSWEPVRQKLTQLTGHDPGDFATGRTELINEASTLPEILGRQDKATAAARDAAKPPDVVDINGISNVWDPQARKFVPQPGGITDAQKAATKQNGVTVTTNPDGTVTTQVGGTSGGPAGTTETGRIEQSQVQASESAGRIAGIMADFKPEYLTIGTKLQNAWTSLKAKFDPSQVSPGDRSSLEKFASFRRKTFEDLNTYLHDLSGAAISPTESVRLIQSRPNPGSGIFDGDDPITFQAKMQDIMDQTQKALVRLNFYKTTKIPASLDEIPLANVKKLPDGKWYVKAQDGQVYEVGAPP